MLSTCSLANRNTGPSSIYSSLVSEILLFPRKTVFSPMWSILPFTKMGSRDSGMSCVFAYCIGLLLTGCEAGVKSVRVSFITLNRTCHVLRIKLVSCGSCCQNSLYCKRTWIFQKCWRVLSHLFGCCLCCLLVGIAIVCWLMNYAMSS